MAYPAAKSGFSLEDLTRMGPDEITRKRKIAEALLAQSQGIHPIANPLEGMAQMAQALVGNLKLSRLDRAEREGKEGANALFSAGMGMGEFPARPTGGESTNNAPISKATSNVADGPKGQESYMNVKSGIASTAQALGIDPVDLATAISYETGGTFDPTQGGPTTKWGKHRGLIQFGEPQAAKYGVDWNDPVGSQLGPDGAVAKYLRDTGVKPGMGLLDIYAAINAGGVGKYDASDAGAGGAPGTVRDKVEQQMGAHRAKAMAMFGGGEPANVAQAPGAPVQVASLDPSIGVPPAPGVPAGVNPASNQAAVAKALIEQGIDPNGPQAQAFASIGAGNPGAVNTPSPAAVDPAAQVPLPTPAAPNVAPPGTPAAQAPLPQQQQMAQALIQPPDPAQTLGAPAIQPGGPDMGTLMNMSGNEFMSPQQQKMIEVLTGRRMEQADPEYQLGLELKRAQLDAAKRPPKAWQKLDDDTLFDPISGETKELGAAGGPTKFEGTSMDAQAWNILQSADPSSREYATAYSIVSQPKTQLIQTENGMMPVEVPPQLPGWLKAPGDAGPAAAAPGSSPGASPDARAAFDAAAGAPPPATPGIIPGTQKAKTEAQGRNATLTTVLENEIPTINQNWGALSDPKGQLLTAILGSEMSNPWQSEEYQRAFNAVQDSATNVLYSLSGASSNPGEAFKKGMAFMPKFGDKPGAIADKLNRFKAHVRGIAIQSGDPEMVKNVNKMLEGLTGKPSTDTSADKEGWKELAPGVKIRPKGQ